jgi:nucleotide-binding universal stress UspA family protein
MMEKRLLVPFDGSKLAEEALTQAGELAESLAGRLVLVRVVAPPAPSRFYAPNLLQQVQEAQVKEAEAYLAGVAKRLGEDRLQVETHVLTGEVAPTLVRLAQRAHCFLIVIGSHGMGGLGSHVFGSIAQKVLHTARCPVLVVRSTPAELEREEEAEEWRTDEVLLTELQGSKR